MQSALRCAPRGLDSLPLALSHTFCCSAICTLRSYPNQMLEIFVRMYLYRWHKPATPGGPVYSQISLEVRSEGSMSHDLCLFCCLAFSGLCTGPLPAPAGGVRANNLPHGILLYSAWAGLLC